MYGLLTTTKIMPCFGKTLHYPVFSFAVRVVAVGKIPARLKSGEIMRFATGKQD